MTGTALTAAGDLAYLVRNNRSYWPEQRLLVAYAMGALLALLVFWRSW